MNVLRAADPLRVGDVTLVPIERVEVRSEIGDSGCWIGASKEVFAVVVCDAGGVRALAPDSSVIALDAVIEQMPDLGAILSGLSAS